MKIICYLCAWCGILILANFKNIYNKFVRFFLILIQVNEMDVQLVYKFVQRCTGIARLQIVNFADNFIGRIFIF